MFLTRNHKEELSQSPSCVYLDPRPFKEMSSRPYTSWFILLPLISDNHSYEMNTGAFACVICFFSSSLSFIRCSLTRSSSSALLCISRSFSSTDFAESFGVSRRFSCGCDWE